MQHLHTERLAALGDEQPSVEEAAHLAVCEVCTHEVSAYQTLVAMAHAEQQAFGLPLTRWETISAEWAAVAPQSERSVPRARSNRWMLQVAAGLLLVAGGAIAGRMSAGAAPLPGAVNAVAQTADAPNTGAQPVAKFTADSNFASAEEARATQLRAELLYQQSTAYLARIDTTNAGDPNPVAYRSRLAVFDRVLSTTRDALREAPHDPVINGYYLTTLGQREATLRQMNTALPSTLRLTSY